MRRALVDRMRQITPLWNKVFHRALVAIAVAVAFGALAAGRTADADQKGSASGLPVPRYVSLKSDRVNLREGPSKDHRTVWVFQRAGLPVEITAEFEIWRKVRDSEGTEGWVLHSLLSGRRTALVAPWKKAMRFDPLQQGEPEIGAGRDVATQCDRKRARLRRRLVPCFGRRLRWLYSAIEFLGRLSE